MEYVYNMYVCIYIHMYIYTDIDIDIAIYREVERCISSQWIR